MLLDLNIVTDTDSYKYGHDRMLFPEVTNAHAYLEARAAAHYPTTIMFGLQPLLYQYFAGAVVTQDKIDEAEALANAHLGPGNFDRARWMRLLEQHRGKLPVRIRAVAEGTPVPVSNVMLTMEATDDNHRWLPGHLETLLMHVWYPCTVATISYHLKQTFAAYLAATSDNQGGLPFMLHDFGFRGVSSYDAAALGGAAHLTSFLGTDTVPAIRLLHKHYFGEYSAGLSVNASEHSVMTSCGASGEGDVIGRILKVCPKGIVSVVHDSYDILHSVREYVCKRFRDDILARDGVYVIRPDSGDPKETVAAILEILADHFPITYNTKGYRVLPPQLRLIWGDGITPTGIRIVLDHMMESRWSAENIVFGMGGGLLQKLDRDTQSFAFKCSAQKVNGVWQERSKKPKDARKASKAGRHTLIRNERGDLVSVPLPGDALTVPGDQLHTVFENGAIQRIYTLDMVRANTGSW